MAARMGQQYYPPSEMKYPHQDQMSMPPAQEQHIRASPLTTAELTTQANQSFYVKAFLILLWLAGCCAGIVAVINISLPQFKYELHHNNYFHLFAVTIIFGVLAFLPICLWISYFTDCCCHRCFPRRLRDSFTTTVPACIAMFALLWMDWSLGIITGNLVGVPSHNVKTLYWSYFACKRLGLLAA
jgi:hypothetical protein